MREAFRLHCNCCAWVRRSAGSKLVAKAAEAGVVDLVKVALDGEGSLHEASEAGATDLVEVLLALAEGQPTEYITRILGDSDVLAYFINCVHGTCIRR